MYHSRCYLSYHLLYNRLIPSFSVNLSFQLLYHCLGHVREQHLKQALKAQGSHFATAASQSLEQCKPCIQGKHTCKVIGKGPVSRAELPMHLIHSDVCGLLPPSYSCAVFMVSFINDHTHYAHVYFMCAKSEAITKFQEFIAANKHHGAVHLLHFDHGGEYKSAAFQRALHAEGIMHDLAPAYTPEYNGVTEQFNHTIITMARTMLLDAQLPS